MACELRQQPPAWAIRTKADQLALDQGCYWEEERGQDVIDFAHAFFKTQYSNKKFRLYPWQEKFIRQIYSWRLPSGKRRFRFANLHIAKKAGKTLLVSLISLYELFNSREPSPIVIAGAAVFKNARKIFNEVLHSLQGSPLKPFCKSRETDLSIRVRERNALFFCCSSVGENNHGENAVCTIIDEGAWTPDSSLYDALRPSIRGRDDGICIVISTCSDKVGDHWYYDVYLKSKRVLNGEDTDITHYAEVYESDLDSDATDPQQWRKANPSPFDEELFRLDMESYKAGGTGSFLNWQRLYINRWVVSHASAWLDINNFPQQTRQYTDDELRDKPAYIGCDLSTGSYDPSSVSIIWYLGDGKFFLKSWAWVPTAALEERQKTNLPKYEIFISKGSMKTTEGDRIDDEEIISHILDLCARFNVKQINYDPASGGHVVLGRVEKQGYKVESFTTNFKNYNAAMREFEKYWQGNQIFTDGSEWLRYCMANVRIETNRMNEMRPYKKRSLDKIDGIVAGLVAWISAVREVIGIEPESIDGWID